MLYNEISKKYELISLNEVLIIDSAFDLIIDRESIGRNGLLQKCEKQILKQSNSRAAKDINYIRACNSYNKQLEKMISTYNILKTLPKKRKLGYEQTRRSVQEEVLLKQAKGKQCFNCNSFAVRQTRKGNLTPSPLIICYDCYQQPRKFDDDHINLPRCEGWSNGQSNASNVTALNKVDNRKSNEQIEPLPGITANCVLKKEQLWDNLSTEESFDIPAAFDTNFVVEDSEDEYQKVTVKGSDEFQQRVRNLIHEYRRIFSSVYHSEPAKVTPYKFEVNEEEWYTHRNRERFRKQSPIKEEEIFLQVEVMLDNEIISSSDADAWSQVMLTPKPNMKWRFAIDFRRLNETLLKKGFPIPRIKEIIDQISTRKPTVFGKMDLTHGYHQIPIDEECRDYTTFITSRGLYKWNRLPMGLTNAGQYFQKILRTEVLCGLSDHIVLPYLDDMHLATKTEDEFIYNLKEVFKRFNKHNIFVNPNKCFFGLDKLEILGHEISKEGTIFSREKLQGVNDFPLPITSGNLMSNLGLCNYFY